MSEKDSVEKAGRGNGPLKTFLSVAAAAFGVQSNKNREQDFSHGSPLPYIFAGVAFTLIFITLLVIVVNVAIS